MISIWPKSAPTIPSLATLLPSCVETLTNPMERAALQNGTKETRPLPPGSNNIRHALVMLPYLRRHAALKVSAYWTPSSKVPSKVAFRFSVDSRRIPLWVLPCAKPRTKVLLLDFTDLEISALRCGKFTETAPKANSFLPRLEAEACHKPLSLVCTTEFLRGAGCLFHGRETAMSTSSLSHSTASVEVGPSGDGQTSESGHKSKVEKIIARGTACFFSHNRNSKECKKH